MSTDPAAPPEEFNATRLGNSADPRAVRTRKALEEALLALLGSKPFDAITTSQVAARAGISRAAFYLHYPSMEAMFAVLMRTRIADLHARSQAVLDALGSRVAALALCEHIEQERAFWAVLFNGGASALARAELLQLAQAVATVRAHPGDRLPSDLATSYATGGMVEVLAWWLRQEPQAYDAEFAADLLVELVFNTIRNVSTSPSLKFR